MTSWQTLLLVWVISAFGMSVGWWWQQRHHNAGIADVLWAAGVGMAAVIIAAIGTGAILPRLTLSLLGGAWAFRLALHLAHRVRGEREDGRYAALRRRWGNDALRWFGFFQLQAFLVPIFALPFLAVAANPTAAMTPWWGLAIAVWLAAVTGESIADRQLARCRASSDSAGSVCRQGLWRYSRHPNYFFEWLHWFAYGLLAIGSPLVWLGWFGPITMFVFLRWISGIPFAEAQALRSKGDAYRAYQRSTSMFFPWFPKEQA